MSYLFECQSACILEVGSLSSEVRMRLIFDDKDDVGGYFVGGLIALALEINQVWPLSLFHLFAPHRVFSFAPSSNFLVSDTCADTAPLQGPSALHQLKLPGLNRYKDTRSGLTC